MKRRGRPFVWGLITVAAVILLPIAAYGAYSALGSSSGQATAATLPAPGKPTIAASNSGLTISWTSTALSTGRAVDSYQLKRTIGTTTTTVCTTNAVTCTDPKPTQPATYVVVAKISGWTSTSAANQFVPDTTPPATPATTVVVPGNADTAMQDIAWQIPSNPTNQFCVSATLTGTSATPRAWGVLIHLDEAPFHGATPNEIFYSGNAQVVISAVAGDSTLARVTGSSSPGNPWNAAWNNALLDTSKTLTITLCDSNPRQPSAGDSSWYTALHTQGTRTATQACVNLTVAATTAAAQNPFYFGWQATVNLTAAKQYLVANGKTVNFVSWSPDPSNGYQFTTSPTVMNPVADSYALTSGRMTPIKAGTSTTISACVHAF